MVEIISEQLCRICLKESYFYSNIFTEQLDDGSHFVYLINDLLQLDMEFGDGYPQFLCSECYNRISEFEIFKRTAHEGKAVLLYSNGIMENNDIKLEGKTADVGVFVHVQNENDIKLEGKTADVGVFVPVQNEVYLVPVEVKEEDCTIVERDPLEVSNFPVCLDISGDVKESDGVLKSQRAQGTQIDALQINEGKKTDLCDKELYNSHRMSGQQSFDTGENSFECILTKNVFSSSRDPNVLETQVHSGEKPLTCDLSGDYLSGNEQLRPYGEVSAYENPPEGKLHEMEFRESGCPNKNDGIRCILCKNGCSSNCATESAKRGQTDVSLFTCKYCSKAFPRRNDLRRHEKTHTDEKRYECTYCSKRFASKGSLKNHERNHTGERPFECKLCNKRFRERGYLKSHERVHTGERPYKCSSCDKTFSQGSTKRLHEKLHTGVKNFKCTFCEKKFSHGNDRRKHERTHTGEKPFPCNICGKAFSLNAARRKHESLHERV